MSFNIHKKLAEKLKNITDSGDFSHLLFHGPLGAGKKTLILALVRELYGLSVKNIKFEIKKREIITSCRSNKLKLEYSVIYSKYHMEINPSDVGNYDIYLIQNIIKEIARSNHIEKVLAGQHSRPFNVLVLNDVDHLSKEAQQSLRRTMEKYASVCRIIMSCENISRIINPLRSRCLSIRVPAPTNQDITFILQGICENENLCLPLAIIDKILDASERNLRRAILCMEALKNQENNLQNDRIFITDWEMQIQDISNDILHKQTPNQLYKVRNKLYELISNCIPPEVIISKLLLILLPRLSEKCKTRAVNAAAHFENRLREGNKAIYHLEAFVANMMYFQYQFITEVL